MEQISKITAYRQKKNNMSLKAFGELFTPPVDKSTVLRWELGRITPARAIEIERITGIKCRDLLPDFFGSKPKKTVREGASA